MKLRLSGRGLVLLSALWLALPAPAATPDEQMRQALEAAREQQWDKIDQAAIENHALAGYVEYHRLRARLPHASPETVNDYLQRHADSPLSTWMRGVAQASYGSVGRYDALLAVSDGKPRGSVRQCHYYTALLQREPDKAAAGGLELWLTGRSQPNACDSLFDTLRERSVIDAQAIWQRQMLAWQNGEDGLARYLARQLPPDWQNAQDAFSRLKKDYSAITRVPVGIGPDGAGSAALFATAMYHFTRADTEAALEAWRKIASSAPLNDVQRRKVEHDLIFYSLVREVDNNRGWVDSVLPRRAEADLLELRVRRALAERDWSGVITWVHRMPDETRREARWQYWLGRALGELGDPVTAKKAYVAAAGARNFYGFAAADRLGRAYALNLERPDIDDALRQRVAQWPAVQRAEALLRIGEPGLARSEWYAAVARASDKEARVLADYAQRRERYPLLVQTTIQARLWDTLDWRFPGAYRQSFLNWGKSAGVDPFLLMGIARRESAFNHEAVSSAGARGLMQLMPGTAAHVSRQQGIETPSASELFEPQINIRLGSLYIRDMLERYRGNRLAATAAYNAGPSRVDRWLREAPQAFDLFVESIPFRETRDYVQAVLAYQVIFASLARGGDTQGVAMLTLDERRGNYDDSLLARN